MIKFLIQWISLIFLYTNSSMGWPSITNFCVLLGIKVYLFLKFGYFIIINNNLFQSIAGCRSPPYFYIVSCVETCALRHVHFLWGFFLKNEYMIYICLQSANSINLFSLSLRIPYPFFPTENSHFFFPLFLAFHYPIINFMPHFSFRCIKATFSQ